jgi:predicted DNA-binding transcriptional regulator AlpA
MASTSRTPRATIMARVPVLSFPETGFLRVASVLAFVPMSRAAWFRGVKAGRYPAPVKLSAGVTAWRAEDIRALIDQLSTQEVA